MAAVDVMSAAALLLANVLEIRKAGEGDVVEILRMMREFAEFEELGQYFEATEERLRGAMFGDEPVAEALVAVEGGAYAGYAIFFPYFASFRAQKGYYLEDLYVDPEFRGRGLGEVFLRAIATNGAARGFERIDFQVLEWNAKAIGFYERLGARRDDTERHFKFTDEAFRRLAE